MKKRTMAIAVGVGALATLVVAASGFGRTALTPLPSSSCGPIQGPKNADQRNERG